MNEGKLPTTKQATLAKLNLGRIMSGTRFINYDPLKKICFVCRKGFNKKKGRERVDSSMYILTGIKTFECAKCFSK